MRRTNRSFDDAFGFAPGQARGRQLFELLEESGSNSAALRAFVERALRSGADSDDGDLDFPLPRAERRASRIHARATQDGGERLWVFVLGKGEA